MDLLALALREANYVVTDFKPITWDALMQLDLEAISELFSFGAVKEGKNRWAPADSKSKADLSLAKLKAEKRKRMDKPRFPRRVPPAHRDRREDAVNPPTAAEIAEAAEASGYTSDPRAAVHAVDAIPPEYQARYTKEAWERFGAARPDDLRDQQAKVLANKIAKLQREGAKLGIDLAPRINGMIREWQAEIVQQRGEAA